MLKAEFAGFHLGLNRSRKAQQAKKIRHGGAIFAGALGHLLLRHFEVSTEAIIRAGLFHWVEIGTLEIFNDRHLHRLLVARQPGRRMVGTVSLPALIEARQRRSPAISWNRPFGSGRTQMMGWTTPLATIDRDNFIQLLLVDLHAGLVWIGVDLVRWNFPRGAARVGLKRVIPMVTLRRACKTGGDVGLRERVFDLRRSGSRQTTTPDPCREHAAWGAQLCLGFFLHF